MKRHYFLLSCGIMLSTLGSTQAMKPLTLSGSGTHQLQREDNTQRSKPSRIVEGGWHSAGTGVWFEGLLTIFDEVEEGLSWEIEIEESDEAPGYYRFIPYHANSPIARIVNAADREYFYLDARDPEKVYSEEFIAYRDFEFNYYFSQIVPENGWEMSRYGFVEDQVVYFPEKSFGYFEPATSMFWEVNFEGDFKIVLPGGEAKPNWNKVYESKYVDGFCGPYFNGHEEKMQVVVEERDHKPGYYRLQGAFSAYGSDHPLIIDATNPNFVVVPYQETGFTHPQRGEVVVYSHCENFISPMKYPTIEEYAEAYPQYVATMTDGMITFPPDAIVLHFPEWDPMIYTTNEENARTSSVRVKDSNGIQETESHITESETTYYNLQGMRIALPEKGMYIVRQGNTTRKVIK